MHRVSGRIFPKEIEMNFIGFMLLVLIAIAACRMAVLQYTGGCIVALVAYVAVAVTFGLWGFIPMLVHLVLISIGATAWVKTHPKPHDLLR